MPKLGTAIRSGLLAATLMALAAPGTANASLVFTSVIDLAGQGFGNAPRALTIQETGPRRNGVESGCVGVSGGAVVVGPGACLGNESGVFMPNGKINVGGDEPPPHADNQKYGAPTLGSLNITNAGQIAVIFNATEPQNNNGAITIEDLTLKIYDGDTLVAAIDGSHPFSASEAGNGNAGFVFTVDQAQQAYLNATVFAMTGFANFRLALEATLSGADGGPDSFILARIDGGIVVPPPQVPEPASLLLLGSGIAGVAALRRRIRPSAERLDA